MTKYREILRLKSLNLSQQNIADSCNVSKKTVNRVLKRAAELGMSWPLEENDTDAVLAEKFFPSAKQVTSHKRMPDYDYIRKELLRNGVSKKLLWTEYMEDCRANGDEPLMYSQFCYHIQQDEQKHRATMHINRKPSEQVEVDWAGDPATIIDPDTGEIIKAYIFVGVMTYSQYAYVEAFLDMKQKSWINAHVHMYEYFGGVAKILVPDNCKTAVVHNGGWKDQQINETYQELAEHYGTAIIPSRVRAPKDKPNAEGTVGNISTWITAALRNEQFFSLAELNASIREKLDAYFEGTKVQMSKRGSAIARRVIHTLTLQSISISRNGEAKNSVLREYYLKKCDSKPKLVAMGAVSHKVCNMIFAILRDNKPFKIIAPQEHIKQYNAAKCDIAA